MHLFDANNYLIRVFYSHNENPIRYVHETVEKIKQTKRPIIWVWDGPGAVEERRKIYSEYKKGRKKFTDDLTAALNLAAEILDRHGVHQICIPGYEADDIIYNYCNQYHECLDVIEIWSTDKDILHSLLPNVKVDFPVPKNIHPYDISLYKTFVGDSSDNIPGLPGFGEKSWDKSDKQELWNLLLHIQKDVSSTYFPIPSNFNAKWIDWLMEEDNRKLFLSYYNVILPKKLDYKITPNTKGYKIGKKTLEEVEAIMKNHML